VTVVVAEEPPPLAVIVTVRVPMLALCAALKVTVVLPVVDSELGLKLALTPLARPDAENVTAELTLPLSVTFVLVLDPRETDSDDGEADRL
jgi:hypothetical protein